MKQAFVTDIWLILHTPGPEYEVPAHLQPTVCNQSQFRGPQRKLDSFP